MSDISHVFGIVITTILTIFVGFVMISSLSSSTPEFGGISIVILIVLVIAGAAAILKAFQSMF